MDDISKQTRRLNMPNRFTKIIKEMAKEPGDEPLQGREQQRLAFETEFAPTDLDFTRAHTHTHGYYESDRTNAILYGFRTALKEGRRGLIQFFRGSKRRDLVGTGRLRGPFVVGTFVDDNTMQFGYRPVRHVREITAIKEAQRISERYGKQTAVLGVVHHMPGEVTKVEESKQKEYGKKSPTPNAGRVLQELAAYHASHTTEMTTLKEFEKTPYGLSVNQMYVWDVKNALGGVIGTGTFDQCLHFIHTWLAMKNPKPELQEQANAQTSDTQSVGSTTP